MSIWIRQNFTIFLTRLTVNRYPGPIVRDGIEEYYVDAIFMEASHVNEQDKFYIVIWTGWPTELVLSSGFCVRININIIELNS